MHKLAVEPIHVLPKDTRLAVRDELRAARARAMLDAEGFQAIVIAIERLGILLTGNDEGMNHCCDAIEAITAGTAGAGAARYWRAYHTPYRQLYKLVRVGRNKAVHEGAYARHLARHAIELSLLIEEGIMSDATQVSDYMVREPVCAAPWQPVSFARQAMLVNSFSFLPIRLEGVEGTGWRLLAEFEIARYLRGRGKAAALKRVGDAVTAGELHTIDPHFCQATDRPEVVLDACLGKPALVVSEDGTELLGIVAPFDLL